MSRSRKKQARASGLIARAGGGADAAPPLPGPPHEPARTRARHNPDVSIDRAQVAWGARRFDEAIAHYEEALSRDPRNPVLLVDMARAYALRYRYADAQKLIDRAQALYPGDAHVQRMLGRSYMLVQQFDRAIESYTRALELEPSSPERPGVLLELARMHERLHDLDAARRCARGALDPAPPGGAEAAQFLLGIIDRRAGDPGSAESRWRAVIESRRAPPGVVSDCWYELAGVHDAAGRYDEAFADLLRAKQILSMAAAPYRRDAAKIGAIGRRTFDTLTPDHLLRWSAAGDRLPPLGPGGMALLTSHPRSGTTLLEQMLDSHPGVISADELQIMPELVYAPIGRAAPADSATAAFDLATPDQLVRARGVYWAAMEQALREPVGGRLLLDKNPELTMLLPLVARAFPEMKVLFVLRDPRDVVLSCFMQRLPLNAVSVHYLTLEGTVRKYATVMYAWLMIRGMLRNPWIEPRYEATVADPEGQARRTLDFLGLPWDPAVASFHKRAQRKHVRSPTYAAVTKPAYTSSVGRWRNYAAQLDPYMGILGPLVEKLGYA